MKSQKLIIAGEIIAALLLAGCASKSTNFEPPLPTVELKANPSVKITTVGKAPMLNILAGSIGEEFKKNGGQVVDSNPDYWLVIYGVEEMRNDTPEDVKHNIIFSKTVKKNKQGGEEFLVRRNFSTAANANFVSVALYEVKTLTPMVNMDVPFYSSNMVDGGKSTALRSDNAVAQEFVSKMNQIIFKKK